MGLLNSIKKFDAPAFSPVMLNLGIICKIVLAKSLALVGDPNSFLTTYKSSSDLILS